MSYWIEVKTTSPDDIPECDYSFEQFEQWRKTGESMYRALTPPSLLGLGEGGLGLFYVFSG
ncbi:MAG: hypothetical protein V7K19_17200 [Nostoc sp.]